MAVYVPIATDIPERVRFLLGNIESDVMSDKMIESFEYLGKAIRNVTKVLTNFDKYTAEQKEMLDSAIIYSTAALLCHQMPFLLPQSGKTQNDSYSLQNIDYEKKANDLLGKANEIIADIAEDTGLELQTASASIFRLTVNI